MLASLCLVPSLLAQVPAGYAGKPYRDSVQIIPGILQPEHYDEGGSGVAWFDTDAHIGAYNARNPTGVDLDPVKANDPTVPGSEVKAVPGAVYWGWLVDKEWVKLTVDVKEAGTYAIHALVGTAMHNTSFRVDAYRGGDSATSGALTLPFGGSCPVECYHYWNYAKDLGRIRLQAGLQVIRLQIVKSGYNIEYVELRKEGVTTVPRPPGMTAKAERKGRFNILGRLEKRRIR